MDGNSKSDHDFLKQLTEIRESNLTNAQFGVSELARELGTSRSNLHRKVRKTAKISVSQFISRVRLKKAIEYYKQVIAMDSNFALAYAGIAVSAPEKELMKIQQL